MAQYLENSAPEKARNSELRLWLREISLAEKEFKSYWDRCKKIVKRYRDDDRGMSTDAGPSRFNILWSNIQTIGPALYSRTPKIQVARRFKDPDPVARVASHVLERATEYSIDSYDFDSIAKAIRDDLLLVGRGTGWIRYEPVVNEDERVSAQQVRCDHVHWRDFLHAPAKRWEHTRWVGRCIYLSRKQLRERFGKELGNKIELDFSGSDSFDDDAPRTTKQEEFRQARIYEIWDSENLEVLWISKNYPEGILDKTEDPLGLDGFYPTPRPWYSTTTTDTLIPIPDYAQYQDQARELDDITSKICLLVDALRVVGCYDATQPMLGQLLNGTRNNELIPVANWGALAAQGGIKGAVDWMPIEQIAATLAGLYDARDRVKALLYEITGIADVIRGATSPVETATAQQIKGQFATLRLSDKQREAQRYFRDMFALTAELIAEHFDPNLLAQMAGVPISIPQVQELFYPAMELLRQDTIRNFRIDIETDSMVAIDEALDKQKRTEFLQAFGGFLEGAVKASQAMPVLAPMMGEALLFLVRGYPAGRSMEASIEQSMQSLSQMAQQSLTQPKQDPKMMEIQANMQAKQAELQMTATQKQQELAFRQQESQIKLEYEAASKTQDLQFKAMELKVTEQKAAMENDMAMERLRGDHFISAIKADSELKMRAAEIAQHDELETKKALLKSGAPPEFFSPKGKFMGAHPTVVKEGTFSTDPITGQRRVRIIEQPIYEEGA